MGLTYHLKIPVVFLQAYIAYSTYSAYSAFLIQTVCIHPLAGHSDRMIILKSAAYYALIDEELEEILSCDNEPVLRAYVAGLFRAACRLWKFVMPVEARAVFQNDVFHPATVVPNLQAHLGLSLEKRIFDKYVAFYLNLSYITYITYFTYSATNLHIQLGW
jgi:hypothetical protein